MRRVDAVTDYRQQEPLTQQRQALRQLHLHLLYPAAFPGFRIERFSHLAHDGGQLFAADGLEQVIHRMDLQCRPQIISIVMPANEHNFGKRKNRTHFFSHPDSVHRRHLHIRQHDIRLQPLDQLKSRIPVIRRSNQLNPQCRPVHIAAQPVQHRRLIINNDQCFHWNVPFCICYFAADKNFYKQRYSPSSSVNVVQNAEFSYRNSKKRPASRALHH
ncbi:hypothetical protein D3C75_594140 [compost metagenome]